MSEIKSTAAVNINNANKGKKHTSFAAVTPMQKKENEVRKQMAYTAGKYVIVEDNEPGAYKKICGILVCLAKKGNVASYCIMDKDRNVQFATISYYDMKTLPSPIPMEFSVLEYLRQREVDALVAKVEDAMEKTGYTALTRITVNWKKQYGPQDEKASTNNKTNSKKNNKSVNRK